MSASSCWARRWPSTMVPTRYGAAVTGAGKGLRPALTPLSCHADLQGPLEEVRGPEGDRHPDIGGEAALSLGIPPFVAPSPGADPLVSFSFRWASQESLSVPPWFVYFHSCF